MEEEGGICLPPVRTEPGARQNIGAYN
jgi:hypothetical protein